MKRKPLPLARDLTGKRWWRSLGERAGSPELAASLEREFPEGASLPPEGIQRRAFLSLMGASLALGGLAGCRRPVEQILPYSRAPEEVVPGKPLFFATAMPLMGTAFGLLVESHEGRPTKIEGNPGHPESLGATTLYGQSWVLDLYDPDRSGSPRERGQARPWSAAAGFLRTAGERLRARRGRGLAVLTEAHRSPALAAGLAALREAMPEARIVRYEPFSRDAVREGARIAFGRPLETTLDLSRARVIVALDADLLAGEGSPVKQARGFAEGRAVERGEMSRLYAVESAFSITGASADHRLRLRSRDIAAFTFALATELGRRHGAALGEALCEALEAKAGGLSERARRYVAAVARDLAASRGRGVVVAGRGQPPEVHAVAHLLNAALDNTGSTVIHVAPFDAGREGPEGVVELARWIESGEVETLLVLGGNPAFDAPADARFSAALARVPVSVHLSSHVDETSEAATWHLNRAHPLEAWGDVRAEDGTASILQPLIAPLFGGRTDAEVVELLLGGERGGHDLVRAAWRGGRGEEADFERAWRRALHDGLWQESRFAEEPVSAAPAAVAGALRAFEPAAGEGLEVTFRPDLHAWDGRFANNGWLQELPDPMTKLTWGNAAAISPATAAQLGVQDGDEIAISGGGASIRVPALVAPGQADGSIALTSGQGRRAALRVGRGVGVDTGPLRRSAGFHVAGGFSAERTGATAELPRTQEHFAMEGRPLAREGTLDEYRRDPEFAKKQSAHPELFSLFKEPDRSAGHAWGMTIDLNACTGCSACVVACQAENNIPLVGAEGVNDSREMHWIRVDRYFEGAAAGEPESIAQPVLCQHCENAPCEQVCPVGATVHSPEGLNDMAYNRCIGTRYCANNCPFKVRRFNFLEYNGDLDAHRRMQMNPEVTVRSRGVMEKCTFCVQRVNRAKIDAKRQGRDRVADGEVVTACQGACPTQAISFGDLNDPSSRVAARAADPRRYRMLEELNVKPRITYLARVRNRNPELDGV